MEYVIAFIGLIMIVQADDIGGQSGAYAALVPQWEEGEVFCPGRTDRFGRQFIVPKHAAYIRVVNTQLRDESGWPAHEVTDCIDRTCKLYRIPVASDLTVDGGFTPRAGVQIARTGDKFCRLPQLHLAPGEPRPVLDPNAIDKTILHMNIAGGTLGAYQMVNDMVISTLRVQPTGRPEPLPIVVRVTPRDGSAARTLILEPRALVMVMNMPPEHAAMNLAAHNPDREDTHYALYQKLLAPGTGRCAQPPNPGAACFGNEVTLNLSCSGSGCC